jgi:hypothetical protein
MSESDKDDRKHKTRLWGTVNPDIWAPGPRKTRLRQITGRISDTVSSVSIIGFALMGPAAFLVSLLFVYYVAGSALFGPALLAFWAVVVTGFVLALEKTGYARNFENWGFRLTLAKIIALPASFLIIVGMLYLLIFLVKPH